MTTEPDAETGAAADAATTAIGKRMVDNGTYDAVMAGATPAERDLIEAAFDRHAERMRAYGEPGW